MGDGGEGGNKPCFLHLHLPHMLGKCGSFVFQAKIAVEEKENRLPGVWLKLLLVHNEEPKNFPSKPILILSPAISCFESLTWNTSKVKTL